MNPRTIAVAALLGAGCGGASTKALPPAETQALCAALLPQLEGEFACSLEELADPTRVLSEPGYDVQGELTFRPSGLVERYAGLRASGPQAPESGAPAECAVNALRRLRLEKRAEALTIPVWVRWREASGGAAALADGGCALTVKARGR